MAQQRNGKWLLACSVAFAMHTANAETAMQPTPTREPAPEITFDTLTVQAVTTQDHSNLLGSNNASDTVVHKDTLQKRATTLGDALSNQVGIHSNAYGGGASAPIIRGQEGKRIKVLQNNADVIDMATMSPDHAIMIDPALAEQVEVVRGATTLLYSSGNAAGLINVIDNKIPTAMPDKAVTGELGRRFNTNNNEDVISGAITASLGNNVALHVEGLHKTSDDYHTPTFDKVIRHPLAEKDSDGNIPVTTQTFDHLPNSNADSQVGSVGLSWIGDKGYLGASATRRRDQYGLPAHNHAYEDCQADVITQSLLHFKKPYFKLYPFLASDSDIDYDNPGLTCHSHGAQDTAHADMGKPSIDLTLTRYDIRGELDQPISGVDKVRFNASQADYHHDELEGSVKSNYFDNQAKTARLELSHTPLGKDDMVTGVWGVQYSRSENSGLSPQKYDSFTIPGTTNTIVSPRNQQPILHNNVTTNRAIFGLERFQLTPHLQLEASGRVEKQQVAMSYDREAIKKIIGKSIFVDDLYNKTVNEAFALLEPHQETAKSYALGANWTFQPDYQLSINASHQERIPNAQELYAHGMHLATNSFEVGNKTLTKEKSNNLELAIKHQGEKLDYQVATYVYDFDNYIYLLALNDARNPRSMESDDDLQVNRYMQSPARFYGVEGNIGYQINPTYHVSLYGDYVNGKLIDIPAIPGVTDAYGNRPMIEQPDRYTPRLPPIRLGGKVNAMFSDQLSAELDYSHVFEQDRLSKFEHITAGYNMLNIGVNYRPQLANMDATFFIQGNNLLNEKVYVHESFLPKLPQMGRNISIGLTTKF